MPVFSTLLILAAIVDAPLLPERGTMALKHGGVSVYTLGRHISRPVARKYDRAARAAAKGDYGEALKLVAAALRQDAGNKEALNDAGVLHQALGDHAKALEWFDLALREDGGYALAHVNRAYSLAALRRPNEAELAARQALRANPALAAAHLVLGMTLISERCFTGEALASLRLARREFPEALLGSAQILLRQGNAREARSHLEAYLSTAAPARADLAKAWLQLAARAYDSTAGMTRLLK